MTLYEHIAHPHVEARKEAGPVKVAHQHASGTAVERFNARIAVIVTKAVGSMWCAYAFTLFDLISLPEAIRGGAATIVAWVAQTFLQLVLLSIIMVGQDVQAKAADARADSTYKDAEAILDSADQIAEHLGVQDQHLLAQDDRLDALVDQSSALAARLEAILAHVTPPAS